MLSKLIRFHRSKGIKANQWGMFINLGKGAGYIWGSTFYLTRNCTIPSNRYKTKGWQAGWTRNGNAIPYTQH